MIETHGISHDAKVAQTTYEVVRKVFIEQMGAAPNEVRINVKLVDLVDSLERAQLILELEESFGFDISEDDLQKLYTIRDIVDYVDSRRN